MFEKGKEFVFPKAKSAKETAIIAAMWVIVAAAVAIIIAKAAWVGGISAMLVVVPIYINKAFTREIACTLTGDKLTAELVDFKQKRTPIGEPVFLEDLEVCARTDDQKHNDALKATYHKTVDARTSPHSKTGCFAAFERDGKRSIFYFEYNEMMIGEMKKYAEDKIFI